MLYVACLSKVWVSIKLLTEANRVLFHWFLHCNGNRLSYATRIAMRFPLCDSSLYTKVLSSLSGLNKLAGSIFMVFYSTFPPQLASSILRRWYRHAEVWCHTAFGSLLCRQAPKILWESWVFYFKRSNFYERFIYGHRYRYNRSSCGVVSCSKRFIGKCTECTVYKINLPSVH